MSAHLSCLGFVACDCYADRNGQAARRQCKRFLRSRILLELLLAPVRLHHYHRLRAMAVSAALTATANRPTQPSGEGR